MEDQFCYHIDRLQTIVSRHQSSLSGQLFRRLTELLESSSRVHRSHDGSHARIMRRIASVFQRLLLELIQSHYNTEQREKDFRRLMTSKGCAIDDPTLMDDVMEILVKLYRAGQECAGQERTVISFERIVLARFIEKELKNTGNLKAKQIERTIQTLYRCSCFNTVKKNDKDINELELKVHLRDLAILSYHCDEELIKIAQNQSHPIRLSPESWAYLLHRNRPDVARMQSILDRCQTTPTVKELEQTILSVGDKYNILQYMIDLNRIQDLLDSSVDCGVDIELLCQLIGMLTRFEQLYGLRQRRIACHNGVELI